MASRSMFWTGINKFRVTSTSPIRTCGGKLYWKIDRLPPGQRGEPQSPVLDGPICRLN